MPEHDMPKMVIAIKNTSEQRRKLFEQRQFLEQQQFYIDPQDDGLIWSDVFDYARAGLNILSKWLKNHHIRPYYQNK